MPASRKRSALLLAAGIAILAAGVALLRPARVPVETGAIVPGPIRETVDATGKTRVRERYVVSTPVAGHLERVTLREGDRVAAGEVVAAVSPAASTPLDARTRAELAARLRAARAAEAEARATAERARVAAEQAGRDRARAAVLAADGAIPPSEAERASAAAATAAEEARVARHAVARAGAEAEAARAALEGRTASAGERVLLRAPAAGRVLRLERESEGPVAAGAAILEVGDCTALEVDLELLTTQAVRVRPGARAEVVRWGGEAPLAAVVRRLDSAAYTKLSALGVEEQRVHAVLDPLGDSWDRLGDGYSVEARVVVSERAGAVLVPASALFRDGARWATFVVAGGRARLRRVEVAEQGDGVVAAAAGVEVGERVVLYPTDALRDGVRVREK
jgi:HlyD family secretion protein